MESIEGIKHECRERLYTWMLWAPYRVSHNLIKTILYCFSGLWIRINFNLKPDADPDPAFLLNPDPDSAPQNHFNSDRYESRSTREIKSLENHNLKSKI
jgi:hypothetical protein